MRVTELRKLFQDRASERKLVELSSKSKIASGDPSGRVPSGSGQVPSGSDPSPSLSLSWQQLADQGDIKRGLKSFETNEYIEPTTPLCRKKMKNRPKVSLSDTIDIVEKVKFKWIP